MTDGCGFWGSAWLGQYQESCTIARLLRVDYFFLGVGMDWRVNWFRCEPDTRLSFRVRSFELPAPLNGFFGTETSFDSPSLGDARLKVRGFTGLLGDPSVHC